jgi:hypothetical protein
MDIGLLVLAMLQVWSASAPPVTRAAPQVQTFEQFAAYAPACWSAARQTRCAVVIEGVAGGTVNGVLRLREAQLSSVSAGVAEIADVRRTAVPSVRVESPCALCGVVRPGGLPQHAVRVDYITFDALVDTAHTVELSLQFQTGVTTAASAAQLGAATLRHTLTINAVPVFGDEITAARSLLQRLAAWPAPMEQVGLAVRPSSVARESGATTLSSSRVDQARAGALVATLPTCQQIGVVLQCRVTVENRHASQHLSEAVVRVDGLLSDGRVVNSTGGQGIDTVEVRRWGNVPLRLAPREQAGMYVTFQLPANTAQLAAVVLYFRGPPGRDLATVPRLQMRVPEYSAER